jgi:hypothetical protein
MHGHKTATIQQTCNYRQQRFSNDSLARLCRFAYRDDGTIYRMDVTSSRKERCLAMSDRVEAEFHFLMERAERRLHEFWSALDQARRSRKTILLLSGEVGERLSEAPAAALAKY